MIRFRLGSSMEHLLMILQQHEYTNVQLNSLSILHDTILCIHVSQYISVSMGMLVFVRTVSKRPESGIHLHKSDADLYKG